MAEYGTCGESEYTMVTFADLFDLRYARIFKAVIGTVDRENNVASIIIDEDCPDLADIDLSAVPFFYHCEDSTGTVEDLARGHLAFSDGDQVFALFVPQNGETEFRFFIVGHVDIRTNKKCSLNEYLIIGFTVDFTTYVTMFDTGTGSVINLEEFINLDEGSPEKPLAFPCVSTAELRAWFNYNFKNSIAPCNIPGGGVPFGPIARNYSWTIGTPNNDGYSLCSITSTAVDIDHPTRTYYENFEQRGYGTNPAMAFSNGTWGGDQGHTVTTETNQGETTDGWEFTGNANGPFYYYLCRELSTYQNIEYDYKGLLEDAQYTVNETSSAKVSIKLLDGNASLVKEFSGSRSLSFIGSTAGEVFVSGESNFQADPVKWNVFKVVGEVGVYTLTGFSLKVSAMSVNSADYYCGSTGMRYNYMCDPNIAFIPNNDVDTHKFVPITTASFYSQIPNIDMTNDVSLLMVMQEKNNTISIGLDNAVLGLVEDVYIHEDWLDMKGGITSVEVVTRKKL